MVQDFKKKEIDFAADMKTITYLLKGEHQALAEPLRTAGDFRLGHLRTLPRQHHRSCAPARIVTRDHDCSVTNR